MECVNGARGRLTACSLILPVLDFRALLAGLGLGLGLCVMIVDDLCGFALGPRELSPDILHRPGSAGA